MESYEEILLKLKENKGIFKDFEVKRIGIFGSIVKGMATERSDIDVYVEFDLNSLTYDKYIGLRRLPECPALLAGMNGSFRKSQRGSRPPLNPQYKEKFFPHIGEFEGRSPSNLSEAPTFGRGFT